ncbi:MAG: B12-binding domain-containing protein [Candidatus Promineifilaceae bacterium]
MNEELVQAIADIEEERALALTQELLDQDEDPHEILAACRAAMAIVGERYEAKEYYLPELLLAGDMLRDIGEMIKPQMMDSAVKTEPIGKVVIGTVAGDVHDVGKDMVVFMLDANNFEVHDLGVDVSAETFVDKIREVQPEVVALSGFLTLAFDEMKNTVAAFETAGLRDSVKVMIGGAPMDRQITEYVGADAFGLDAAAAVNLAKQFVGRE